MTSATRNLDGQYEIRDISPILLSDESITPNNLPRNTQPSFGKYLVRIDGEHDYKEAQIDPKILDNWAGRSRAFWVDKPGRNQFFQEVFKKYSAAIINYGPKHSLHKMLFPRPLSCEFEYINRKRLCNISLIEEKYVKSCKFSPTNITDIPQENACEFSAPFWWKSDNRPSDKVENFEQESEVTSEQPIPKRWRPIPNLIAQRTRTKCQRKEQLRPVGQPFRHEACMFYNEHYPAPKLKLIPQKFSK